MQPHCPCRALTRMVVSHAWPCNIYVDASSRNLRRPPYRNHRNTAMHHHCDRARTLQTAQATSRRQRLCRGCNRQPAMSRSQEYVATQLIAARLLCCVNCRGLCLLSLKAACPRRCQLQCSTGPFLFGGIPADQFERYFIAEGQLPARCARCLQMLLALTAQFQWRKQLVSPSFACISRKHYQVCGTTAGL